MGTSPGVIRAASAVTWATATSWPTGSKRAPISSSCPSRYEPCGLNQIYSLKYGTLPIVRATGGLDDTVEQYDEFNGTGTGFKFWEPSAHAVYYATGWAVSTYHDRPAHIERMIQRAMAQRFSWKESAKRYEEAYQKAIVNKQNLINRTQRPKRAQFNSTLKTKSTRT